MNSLLSCSGRGRALVAVATLFAAALPPSEGRPISRPWQHRRRRELRLRQAAAGRRRL